jgi:hypothetical protein
MNSIAAISKTRKHLQRKYDEIVSLQRKHLKSIKYTGTPENIKEIESLVSS